MKDMVILMKQFMDKNFLLDTETAVHLYHTYAAKQPIIDYHCHISPEEIAKDRHFDNITQLWLGGDHYKWRLIRSNGVPEEEITGDATDRIKFQCFAETLEKCVGNPMYHWTHLELQRYFGYYGVLSGETAEEVWNLCNEKLKNMSVRQLILSSNVRFIGTTDDPIDTLEWHKALAEETDFPVTVAPSFRPDKAINIDKPGFVDYMERLSETVGYPIDSVADVCRAISDRLDYFKAVGCRASDHGLDFVPFLTADEHELDKIFKTAMKGKTITAQEAEQYKTALLLHCAKEYAEKDIVMQLHYNALRNPNSRMFEKLGPDTGYDVINSVFCGEKICAFLDTLEQEHHLPKTVLYSLNPSDNAMLDTILGAFQGTEAAGKLQHGSAWWFNDHKAGMEAQLTSLANLSVLGNFIGMLTDSRSFLSYTRHEYFRRILCMFIGRLVENGEYPNDEKALQKLVEGICYKNAAAYFAIEG